ncbi:MAG: hypothetical protein QM756_37060 [Polyangiaceae bacterium]
MSAPPTTSFTLLSCNGSLLGPLEASPNHSMFQDATSSVAAAPLAGITTASCASANCSGSAPPQPAANSVATASTTKRKR